MCAEPVEALLVELEKSERAFARAYLQYREAVTKYDSKGHPSAYMTVDDAKANAVLFFEQHGLTLPEVIRYRLHASLAIERSVEPS